MEALASFRAEVAGWLRDNCPASQRQPAAPEQLYRGGSRTPFPSEDARTWFECMLARGWTVPGWPVEYGGAGLSPEQVKILKQEMRRLGCRPPLAAGQGIGMLGPALLEFGSEEQKARHLPAIARGEVRWCQGYSEPGAGSDLANVQCKAVDRGDHFLLNGTKIWTSGADKSDWIFCLVRTDLQATKQAGISFLLVDMAQPGISVEPITLISGDSDFCQVFLDNARAEKSDLLGEVNGGWSVAKRLLQHERTLMSETADLAAGPEISLLACARHYLGTSDGRLADPALRTRVAQSEMDAHALNLAKQKSAAEARAGAGNPATTSIFKYCATEQEKSRAELLLALLGTRGLGWDSPLYTEEELAITRQWAFSKALTIAGGSSEIQLNVIAKRVLGLPAPAAG